MAMISQNWGNLLSPRLRKAFFTGFSARPGVMEKIFNVNSSTQSSEEDLAVAGLSAWDQIEDTEAIALDRFEEIGTTEYTHEPYRKTMEIGLSLWEDKKYGLMEKWAKQMGMGAQRLVEVTSANVLNNAFTGGQTGPDGAQLCADSHTLKKPRTGDTATADNKGTAAFSDTELKNAIIAMSDTAALDDAGQKIMIKPTSLIVPPALQFTAQTVLKSAQQSGTANNDVNSLLGQGIEIIVWPYLTSSTAWFLQDKTISELNFYWRVKPSYNQESKRGSRNVESFAGRMRFSVGFSDWRGIWGSTGV